MREKTHEGKVELRAYEGAHWQTNLCEGAKQSRDERKGKWKGAKFVMREKGEANAGEEIGTTNTIYGAVTANTIRQGMGMKMNGWDEGLRALPLELHIRSSLSFFSSVMIG